MAKTRDKKQTEIRDFSEGLKGASAVVFANLSALKVADSTDLRRKSKKEDVKVMTAKKTLLKRALKDAGLASVEETALIGSVSMLLAGSDPIAAAKVIEAFRKDHDNVTILGGLFSAGGGPAFGGESQWLSADQVKAFAKLPSKQELIARVVGSIRAPLSGLVGVLQGNLRNLVYVVNAIKESKS